MKRRNFLQVTALGTLGISLPFSAILSSCNTQSNQTSSEYKKLIFDLLKEWCDGMIAVQIHSPEDPTLHGALGCPACNKIHGRCMDAVYPFLYMADVTGEQKYLDAGIAVFEWAENVTQPDGSWTVIPNPKSWRGISVFGAIALAEALHYHGHLLDDARKAQWMDRLSRVGDYIYKNFDLTFTNINYGFTSVYALNLLGRVLNNKTYLDRSHELAKGVKAFFTEPNKLLFGEGKPSTKKSARGLYPVDLGYNVEESLNGVIMYALHENDEELLQLLKKSMESHLEFMLPDGAWDNSWGTRQAKWSYWGSRTTDGCQTGFGMMSHKNPAFGTAAYLNTELLKRCTFNGLLSGGPHYESHGVLPCVHHTFAHAKPLAALLDLGKDFPQIDKTTAIPRLTAEGIKTFPEIATQLFARGPWRGTVSAYDFVYKTHAQQATGGALAVLFHTKVGTLFAASMAKYMLVEVNNQQPNPGEDFALTPRIETYNEGTWFTNLYDLEAEVNSNDADNTILFDVKTTLRDEDFKPVESSASTFSLKYECTENALKFTAKPIGNKPINSPTALVLPIISPTGEEVVQVSENRIEIKKAEGTVVLSSNVPLLIKPTQKNRTFNMVPGMEAVPILAYFNNSSENEIHCTIQVI